MTFKRQGEGCFISTASSEVPDIERGDLEQQNNGIMTSPLLPKLAYSRTGKAPFLTETLPYFTSEYVISPKTPVI